MKKPILLITILLLFLLAGAVYGLQGNSVEAAAAPASQVITPTVTLEPGPGEERAALVWEGDPLADDNQAECRALRITVPGQAFIGACGAADSPVELAAGQPGGWNEMLLRFSSFTTDTVQGRLEFQGQGQIMSPAWQRAITTWANTTYNELASGRVGAANRTVAAWGLGEVEGQPGLCRQLLVLSHGYAYSNLTPCAGGNVQETVGGWLDTAEWEKFDGWLAGYAPVYQDNNYFSGLGTREMSPAEVDDLADWAGDVYARLRHESPTVLGPGGQETACPEATAGTELLRNTEHNYCLLYPAGYTVEQPNENETVLVVGSLLNAEDPRLHVEVTAAEDLTTAAAAGQLEADTSIAGVEIERSLVTIGGEEAVVLDNLPGQEINRRVIFVHAGRLYNLMFAPAGENMGEAYTRMEALYDLVLRSFTLLPPE